MRCQAKENDGGNMWMTGIKSNIRIETDSWHGISHIIENILHLIHISSMNLQMLWKKHLLTTNAPSMTTCITLRKPINSCWLKNIFFELFSLQLCLLSFHKIMKFYKEFCSVWISRISANFFHRLTSCVVKI